MSLTVPGFMLQAAAMLLTLLLACSGEPTKVEPPPPEVKPSPAPASQSLGVGEVVTPDTILRPTEIKDQSVPALIDVWFDADHSSFDGLKKLLEENGFTILDGDGESWRVRAPEGSGWVERLSLLPEVAKATPSLDDQKLASGATREGSERYGEVIHTWSWKEGGPQQALTNLKPPPPDPIFPQGTPPELVRCLEPLRELMLDGVSTGTGWERALQLEPRAWVAVLEDYGSCEARGYLVLRADAPLDTLTVGGQPLEKADDTLWWSLAANYLKAGRAEDDASAQAAYEMLRRAPDEVQDKLVPQLGSGLYQKKLFDAYEARNPGGALAMAAASPAPALQARAAAEDGELRQRLLQDPKTSVHSLEVVLSIWRPGPSDDPAILERLRQSADPVVRRMAWELTLDQRMPECSGRVAGVDKLAKEQLAALYRECPQLPVRGPAFSALMSQDPALAGSLVEQVLQQPETLLTGIAAVRQASQLGRDDLLEAVIVRSTVARDVRRIALEMLVKAGRSAKATELVAAHGAYLGYRALPPGPASVSNP